MNTAARIQAAQPGVDGILVSAATRATERPIVYQRHEAVTAKGKARPVEVWEAVEAVGQVGGSSASRPLRWWGATTSAHCCSVPSRAFASIARPSS